MAFQSAQFYVVCELTGIAGNLGCGAGHGRQQR